MPKRSEKRETAKAEYIARKSKGEKVTLKSLAEQMGVTYQTLRNWKAADKWDEALPKRKRGGQPGNKNSKGRKNARGNHKGAPRRNKNAEKDGAYSAVFFDMLTDAEKKLAAITPTGGKDALINEMQILKVREHRILEKLAKYEQAEDADEEKLYLNNVMDMRVPVGGKDGEVQQMGMYNKDSAFARSLKLQEALYKVQGRIATIVNGLRALEEADRRMELEKQRLAIMEMRATGVVEVAEPEVDEAVDKAGDITDEAIHKQSNSGMAGADGKTG